MKVFISWSGEKSYAVGNLLNTWLKCVIQAIEPWISNEIDKGSLWFSEINDQLSETKIGIICLTKSNINKPWILFESGALAKGLSTNRICTFLIDLEPSDIKDPLAQFNHTKPDRNGIFLLITTINNQLEEKKLDNAILKNVFDTYWPQFETEFEKILQINDQVGPEPKRDTDDILYEILNTTRMLDKKVRVLGSNIVINETPSTSLKPSKNYFDSINNSALSNLIKARELSGFEGDLTDVSGKYTLEYYDNHNNKPSFKFVPKK